MAIACVLGIAHFQADSAVDECIDLIRDKLASEIFVDTAGRSVEEYKRIAKDLYDATVFKFKLWRPVIVGPLLTTEYKLYTDLGRENIRVSHNTFQEYCAERQATINRNLAKVSNQ